jgi:hypothetical protein
VTFLSFHVADAISAPPSDPWSLVQYGILAGILACLVSRKFLTLEWILRQAEERHKESDAVKDAKIEKLEQQIEKLQQTAMEELIPALLRSTQVAAEYNEEQARQRYSQPEPNSARTKR